MAQLMPARMSPSAPLPWSSRTFPARIAASQATPYRGGWNGSLGPQAVPMQCVPCPWPSWAFAPLTKDFAVTDRDGKSGCFRSNPVSRTATLTPFPVRFEETTPVAWRPQVASASGAAGTFGLRAA